MLETKQPAFDRATRSLLACGALGPPLFLFVAFIEGAVRPGYSAWRHWVSLLLTGDDAGRMQTAAIACGLSVFAFAVGLRRVMRSGRASLWGPLLVAAFGLNLTVAGLFVPDPTLGYPPGAHANAAHTVHGIVHGVAGVAAFYALAAACLVMAQRFAGDPHWKGWTGYSRVTGALVAVFFIAARGSSILDEAGTLHDAPTGLLQRVAMVFGWVWVALLALRLISTTRALAYGPQR